MNFSYIAVPAYNEESTIESLIFDISAHIPVTRIVVVDDGSCDKTAELAEKCGAIVLRHNKNAGKGRAIQTAVEYGSDKGYQWIILMDADHQHPPSYLPEFLQAIQSHQVDVIMANRTDRKKHMPVHRQLSNGITSVMVSLSAGVRIHDSQCGYRAARLDKLKGMILSENGFQLESEMLIKLGRMHARFQEIPIQTVYAGEKSAIHPFRDTIRFVTLFFKSLMWS